MSLVITGGQILAEGAEFHSPGPNDFWQPLLGDGPWALTRHMLVMALVTLGLALWWIASTRKVSIVPTKGQWLFEQVYDFVRNGIARDVIGGRDFKQFVPFLFTMFTFILFMNLGGVIPFINMAPTSSIGVPIALTIIVYVLYHAVGIKKHGLAGYFGSFVPKGLPAFIVPVVWLLEAMSFFITRPLTLALRLFGNMFAGHMVLVLFILGGVYLFSQGPLLAIAGAGSLLMGFLMTVFEMLIQFLQAYVFTLLTASYLAGAVADEH